MAHTPQVNEKGIPIYGANYAERYRYGETISTAFAESTINQVVNKRMVKKQQMRWSQKGAHLLLQVRTRVLNRELRDEFRIWYPSFEHGGEELPLAAWIPKFFPPSYSIHLHSYRC